MGVVGLDGEMLPAFYNEGAVDLLQKMKELAESQEYRRRWEMADQRPVWSYDGLLSNLLMELATEASKSLLMDDQSEVEGLVASLMELHRTTLLSLVASQVSHILMVADSLIALALEEVADEQRRSQAGFL